MITVTCNCGANLSVAQGNALDGETVSCGCGKRFRLLSYEGHIEITHLDPIEAPGVPLEQASVVAPQSWWRTLGMVFLLKRFAKRDGDEFLQRMLGDGPRPRRRVWERMHNLIAETCNECGRIIEPGAERFRDWVSGHLRRHVECHERAEATLAVLEERL